MFHREFLWPISTKWVQTLTFCITSIKNSLNTNRSLHSRLNFTFLSILVNLLLTGNDMCQSGTMPWSFIIVNASRSINLFSSVEAYLL